MTTYLYGLIKKRSTKCKQEIVKILHKKLYTTQFRGRNKHERNDLVYIGTQDALQIMIQI